MASIKLTGDTSGVITVSAPASAGTNTITLPATTGTMALTSDITTEIPSQTGNSGKYLTTNGSASSWGTVASGGFTTLGTVNGSVGTTLRFSGIDCSAHKFLVFSVSALTAASVANPIFKLGSLNATTGDWIPGDAQTSNTFEGMIWLDTSNNTGIIEIAYNVAAVSAGDSAYGGASIHRMHYSKGSNIQLQTNADIDFTLAGGVAYTGGSITLYGVS